MVSVDGGSDAGVDAGVDAHTVDAGPWEPSFAPRVLYHDPSIVCAPPPATTFAATRTPASPGDVRWVYSPNRDPAYLARAESLAVDGVPLGSDLALSPEGSIMMNLVGGGYSLEVSADGRFLWMERVAFLPDQRPPPMALASGRPLYVRYPVLVDARRDSTGGLIPREAAGRNPWESFPVPLPGTAEDNTTLPPRAMPALLADGSVAFVVSSRLLAIACLDSGRIRTIVEHDSIGSPAIPLEITPMVYAAGDELVFLWGAAYRLRVDGSVAAQGTLVDPRTHRSGRPLGMSERCGIAVAFDDRVGWIDPVDFSRRASFARGMRGMDFSRARPTSSCGFVELGSASIRRVDPVTRESVVPNGATVEGSIVDWWLLEDGGILLVSDRAELEILDTDGMPRWSVDLDRAVVGNGVLFQSSALSPDGVLTFVTDTDLGRDYRIVSVEVGVTPTYPTFWPRAGLDWALRNAPWTIP